MRPKMMATIKRPHSTAGAMSPRELNRRSYSLDTRVWMVIRTGLSRSPVSQSTTDTEVPKETWRSRLRAAGGTVPAKYRGVALFVSKRNVPDLAVSGAQSPSGLLVLVESCVPAMPGVLEFGAAVWGALTFRSVIPV